VNRRTSADRAASCQNRRRKLMVEMGGKCWQCGAANKLEFDGLYGHERQPRTLSRWTRIKQYETQWREGTLRLLCRHCNAQRNQIYEDGFAPVLTYAPVRELADVPF
jgi:hypothetical protein